MKEQTPKQPAFSWKGRCFSILFSLGLVAAGGTLNAQTYTPLAVSGFTQDGVAETGSSSLAVTSTVLDGLTSNNVMYTKGFAAANGGFLYGLPDNGLIVSGTKTYQLQPYGGNNILYLSNATNPPANSAVTGTLTLYTPAILSRVSVLCFSTEGTQSLTATLNFTDGTSVTTATAAIPDWFGTSTVYPTVMAAIGRVSRATAGPYTVATNASFPKLASWDIAIPCASQGKALQSITFNSIAVTGYNRAIILGLSGAAYTPTVVSPTTVIPAHCGTNSGLITLSVSGSSTSYSYSWNTTPVQTTNVASNLAAGTYTCTVTDASGCTFPYTGTITAITASTLTATASLPTVCTGNTTTLSVSSNTSTPTTYTWTPGGQTGTSITVSPSATTTYTVTGADYYGCAPTATVQVTVKPGPTAAFTVTPDPSCSNSPQTVTFTGTAGSTATYDWGGFAGATVKSGSGAGPYSIQFGQAGNYNVQLKVTENGCTSNPYTKALTITGPGTAPVISIQAVTTTSVTFSWLPVAGATGYQVSVNGGAYTDPSSGAYGTTHTVNGLTPLQTISFNVIALAPTPCQASPAGTSTAKTLGDPIFIPNSFSPNSDGKNDVFKIYSNLVTSMDMKIFNQWGELIYSTGNLGGGWDGSFKGKAQPAGVYIYAIRVKLTDGTETVRKGAVNLLH